MVACTDTCPSGRTDFCPAGRTFVHDPFCEANFMPHIQMYNVCTSDNLIFMICNFGDCSRGYQSLAVALVTS